MSKISRDIRLVLNLGLWVAALALGALAAPLVRWGP